MNLFSAILTSTLVYLDSWPIGQFLLGRPVFLLPLLGLACGLPWVGLWLGILLELITLRTLPLGNALPPDPALAGVWALLGLALPDGAVVRMTGPDAQVVLSLLIALPLCWLAPGLTQAQRKFNGRFWHPRWEAAVQAGDTRRCNRLMAWTLAQTTLLAAGVSLLMLPAVAELGSLLAPWAERIAHGRMSTLLPLPWVLVAVSLGGLWRHAGARRANRPLWTGALAGLLLAAVWLTRIPW